MRATRMLSAEPMAERTPVTALLFADARALRNVAGLSLLGRQLKQLRRLGLDRIVVAAPPEHIAAIGETVGREIPRAQELLFVENGRQLEAAIDPGASGAILALRGHSLVDSRILSALLDHPADHVMVCRGGRPVAADAVAADAVAAEGVAAAKAPSRDLRAIKGFDQLIARMGAQAMRLDMATFPTYDPELRRHQPMMFEVVTDAGDGARLTRLVIRGAQKGTLDWPARFLHPPLENLLTRLVARTSVTPNQTSLFVAAVGFAAAWFFAGGRWAVALPLALIVGVLDGVDGKLARTKLMQTKIGQAEHILDKVVEYSWYFALAFHFAPLHGDAVWALALLVVGFSAAEAVQGEFYRRLTGAQLDDAGRFERNWRLVAGRRNTFIWTFALCVLLGAAYAGFWLLSLYALVTFFIAQVCFIIRLAAYAAANSNVISRNVRRTSY